MYRTIYIDLIFITNLVMDFILLTITGRCMQLPGKHLRVLAGAVTGALLSCLVLIIPMAIPNLVEIVLNAVIASFMILITWKQSDLTNFLRTLIFLYMESFLCGGIWDLIFREGEETLPVFFLVAGLTFAILYGCSSLYIYIRKQTRTMYPVLLFLGKKAIRIRGFYDTGNNLIDSYYHKPVSIMQQESLAALLDNVPEENLRPHYIPYEGIGIQGVMQVLILEGMCIETSRGEIFIAEPFIGITTGKWEFGKNNQILLNANLLNN